MQSATKQTCSATTKRGSPCRASAVERGLCAAHSGRVDMAEIGAKGGKQSVRSRLGLDDVADEELRSKARRKLNGMLDSDDPRLVLRASQSLFSYASTRPKDESTPGEETELQRRRRHKGVDVGEILEILVFEANNGEGHMDDKLASVIRRCARRVDELELTGKIEPQYIPPGAEDPEAEMIAEEVFEGALPPEDAAELDAWRTGSSERSQAV